jgi:hypothetical protein
VNNNDFYGRRDDRTMPEPPTPQPPPDEAASALAVHGDPSIPASTPASTAGTVARPPRPGVAWVRPSEMPTLIGSSWARRGIDLQSELVRRSRRAPLTATRVGRRITRSAIARPEDSGPTVTSPEELGL